VKPNPPLDLLRALARQSTAKTWDPTVGLFWDADRVSLDLFPRDVAVEAVTIVRRAIMDCLGGMADSAEICGWEGARERTHRDVVTILRRAEDRLAHGTYRRDEGFDLVFEMNEPGE
jgi:hypothetical protein